MFNRVTKNSKTSSESKKCERRKKAIPRRFTKVEVNNENANKLANLTKLTSSSR